MNTNNRQRPYKDKVYPERKVYHKERKGTNFVFVEGPAKDPYEGIACESLKLHSRITAGTFENHEGSTTKLEKASGADKAQEMLQRAIDEREQLKQQAQAEKDNAAYKAAYEKTYNELTKNKNKED